MNNFEKIKSRDINEMAVFLINTVVLFLEDCGLEIPDLTDDMDIAINELKEWLLTEVEVDE